MRAVPAALVLMFASCSLFPEKTATLWTNRPEFAFYAEIFNAEQNEYRIEIEYREYPGKAMEGAETVPDLVIGENLRSVSIIKYFESLEGFIKRSGLPLQNIYPALYETCLQEGNPVLLPVSFNLPALMFKENGSADLDSFFLSLESIMEQSKKFNAQSTRDFAVMGFSPRWEPEILYIKTLLLGVDFHETSQGQLAWNEQRLRDTVDYIRTWIRDVNGGPEKEQEFTDKFLYDPGYKLISSGRIGFYYTTLRDFFGIPVEKRNEIDYRWIAKEGKIPVLEDILYMGIPKQARNKRAAQAFISWFLSEETQEKIMEQVQERRLRLFGIAEGFSSLQHINEQIFPRFYPDLVGHIPPAEYLKIPGSLPPEWKKMKEEVLLPWLIREASGTGTGESLDRDLKTWILQKRGS